MFIRPANFLSDWNKNVDNKYVIDCQIDDDDYMLLVSENIKEISMKHPELRYMVTDLYTSKVLAYGKSPTELGLNLVNKYKGMRMDMFAVYKSFGEFYDIISMGG